MNSSSNEYQLLVAKRKNRKGTRKKKGRNTQGWEQLRERGVLGISTLDGGGIVSAPIAGKALPKIGRRIVRRFAKFNPKPKDADNDLKVQEGTIHERVITPRAPEVPKTPAPRAAPYENKTPYAGSKKLIKEQRKQTKKFELWARAKNWKKFHQSHFDWWTFPIDRGSIAYGYKYTPPQEELEKLKNNIPYLNSLRKAASLYLQSMAWNMADGDWIDDPDFDRGQEPLANINQARLFKIARSMQIHNLNDEFRSIRRMVESLRNAGVKVGNENYWDNPGAYKYDPISPINSAMQQALPNPQSSGGVSGRMGISYNPSLMKGIDGKEQRFGIENDPDFRARYDDLDREVELDYLLEMGRVAEAQGGKVKDPERTLRQLIENSFMESFYWRDERSRIIHAALLDSGRTPSSNNKRGGIKLRTYPITIAERQKKLTGLTKVWNKIAPLFETYFGWVTGQKSNYPGVYDMSQVLVSFASTPKNMDVATANTVQTLLGHLDKYHNPTQYQKAFEEWIRNPHTVMKDARGNIVGIRLRYDNDRKKMMAEFDRRISSIKDDIAEILQIDRAQLDRELPPNLAARKYLDESPEQFGNSIMNAVNTAISSPQFSYIDSLDQLSNLASDELFKTTGLNESSRGLNGEVLKILFEDERNAPTLARLKRLQPNIFNPSPFDLIPASELAFVREMIDLHLEETAGEKQGSNFENVRNLFGRTSFDDNTLSAIISERLKLNPTMPRNPNENFQPRNSVSGQMSTGASNINATNISANPDNPASFTNHSTSLPSAFKSLQPATDSLEVAASTGRPISWLMPGQLHPLLNNEYNKLVEDIKSLGVTDVISLVSPPWQLSDSGAFTPKEVAQQDKVVENFTGLKFKYMVMFQSTIALLGELDNQSSQLMALGLVQRAANQAVRAKFLEQRFKSEQMTEEILEQLSDATEEIFDKTDLGVDERVVIGAPISVIANVFSDGQYKTQFETNTSQGSLNPDLRKVQELAMFAIHPKAKQRPIYGTVNRGMDSDIAHSTSQYGGAKIVLKEDVNERTTWTQADSLSQQTNASTLRQNDVTWDGLYMQSLHPRTKQAYFARADFAKQMIELGMKPNYENWPFIEAQVHGGISIDDISHIIIDEEWFENNPEFVSREFGDEYDEYSWQDSPKWDAIVKTAQSLNIPIVMLREGLENYDVLEEPGR